MKVKFTILGDPQGKGRHRTSIVAGHTKSYTPDKTVIYENLIKMEYLRQCSGRKFDSQTALDMRVVAYYPIPKSTSKKKREAMLAHKIRPIKKPDSSNVLKAVEDALNGVAYHDDTQIVDSQIRRFYGENPRVVVTIQECGGAST